MDPSTNWLVLGGLPRLVAALGENFQFSAPQASRIEQTPVWILDGQWDRQRLAERQPDRNQQAPQEQAAQLTGLAPQLPTSVRLVLGQADLLPRRIEYHRLEPNSAPGRLPASRPVVVLEVVELQAVEDLDESLFAYEPGKQEFSDFTDLYLQGLQLAPAGEPAGP